MKAHAVVFEERERVVYREVECPEPDETDVVVRITKSWISNGTEGSYLRGERIAGDTARREGDPDPFPIVAGYQKVGVVERVGAAVEDISVGEIVFVTVGKMNGMFAPRGGHVSPSISERSHVWRLPEGTDPEAFSGMVLTQVGYNCGTRAPVRPGDTAVVIGDGMVGQWAAQTLAWQGAGVVLLGHHENRLRLFEDGPFRLTLDTSDDSWDEELQRMLDDLGDGRIAVLVDTAGSMRTVMSLWPKMRRFGHIVSAGFYGTKDLMALQYLRAGELSVDLVSGWQKHRMDETLRLIAAGYLQTQPLITHRFPVEEAASAWELIRSKGENVLGVVLEWS